MQLTQIASLLICVAAISTGQILFKVAASQAIGDGFSIQRLAMNVPLLLGVAIYGAATLFWIWLLRITPLTTAYPFMAISFILVPAAAAMFLGEPIYLRTVIGSILIAVGIFLTVAH